MNFSPALAIYRVAASIAGAFAGPVLNARARDGKEEAARLDERFGRYAQDRPPGKLIWLHAASVGESGVALALIEAMAAREPSLSFLLSTGTKTSAELVARRALPRVIHVYAPLDSRGAVRRFFEHWRPDAGAFIESELWPNLILEAQSRRIPLALINARMSPASLRRWLSWRAAARTLFGAFAYVSAADSRTAEALARIRNQALSPANLKLAAPAPRLDADARTMLAAEIGARRVWLAASTHAGEDEIALQAHRTLLQSTPDALLILVPRHPERAGAVAALAGDAPRRSLRQPIGAAPIYIADTLGELGLFYDLAPVALVAGSLLPHLKGHNPVEPAKLDAAIVTGPHVESFQDLFDALIAHGGAVSVTGAPALAETVGLLWRDVGARRRQLDAARAVTARGAEAFNDAVSKLLALTSHTRQTQGSARASA